MEPTNDPNNSKPQVPPIAAPTGIDLHPAPRPTVRISKRAGIAILGVIGLLLLGFAWGGYRRSLQNQATARLAGLPRTVTPAQADDQLLHTIPPADSRLQNRLVPPKGSTLTDVSNVGPTPGLNAAAPCGRDAAGMPMRFNPQTGQPCDLPVERVVVRQAPPSNIPHSILQPPPAAPPEDHTLEAAWQLEHEAMLAPTTTRIGATVGASSQPAALAQLSSSADQISNLTAVGKALGLGSNTSATPVTAVTETDYEAQNAQTRKDAFLKAAQNKSAAEDYLHHTRDAPLSRYEIKAGWEIPAVLEQSLNSDLPGELKALVTSNVYDTATGQYRKVPGWWASTTPAFLTDRTAYRSPGAGSSFPMPRPSISMACSGSTPTAMLACAIRSTATTNALSECRCSAPCSWPLSPSLRTEARPSSLTRHPARQPKRRWGRT